jgi:hypothetical protein
METFYKLFEILTFGADNDQKNEANKQILEFIATPEAW